MPSARRMPCAEQAATSSALPGSRAPNDLFGIQAFFTVVIFSIFVITFIVQAFQIPSGSMENTLLVGDFLLVDKLHFAVDGPAGAPAALWNNQTRRHCSFLFSRGAIAIPGETRDRNAGRPYPAARTKMVYVNGEPLQESYAIHSNGCRMDTATIFPTSGAIRVKLTATGDTNWQLRERWRTRGASGPIFCDGRQS